MIYQLAKTTPLLSGQVKINCLLTGNRVEELQYVPISNSIPFNYSSPQDVLNYSHGENIRTLYNKISDNFYSSIGRSDLSPDRLHRYEYRRDDTHDGTYEMGMKRLSYQRYKKQYEFLCPVWCDNKTDFDSMVFEMCFAHAGTGSRVMYSKYIEFSDQIKEYFKNIFTEDDNEELVYLGFEKMESHISGVSVKTGKPETCDTSFIMPNLIEQERPVMETDNMIANLFAQKKLIAKQLFNFNFVFNLEDIVPVTLIDAFFGERINVYFNVYYGKDKKQKASVKDFYTNYDIIPKYDIEKGEYIETLNGSTYNVFNYMKENQAIELITKNRLIQSTFHWALRSNKDYIFNLYSGFAPVYNPGEEYQNSTYISSNDTDMFTDVYSLWKNPLGLFKYNDMYSTAEDIEVVSAIENNDSYYCLDLTSEDGSEKNKANLFGNIILDSIERKKFIDGLYFALRVPHRYGIIRVPENFAFQKIVNSLNESLDSTDSNGTRGVVWEFGYLRIPKEPDGTNGSTGYETITDTIIGIKDDISGNTRKEIKFIVITKNINSRALKWIFYNSIVKQRPYSIANRMNFMSFYNPATKANYAQDGLVVKVLTTLADALNKTAIMPSKITLYKSVSTQKTNTPDIRSTEVELTKIDKHVILHRYGSNLIPMFIDLDDPVHYNMVYWVKQYDRSIENVFLSTYSDIDKVASYVKYSSKKFDPVFKSIGYYPMRWKKLDIVNYYLDGMGYVYQNEKEWYKNNSLVYLSPEFTVVMENVPAGTIPTESDLLAFIKEKTKGTDFSSLPGGVDTYSRYIRKLYEVEYNSEYVSDTNVNKQNITIKFKLK